jgi:hypothetical protein
LPFGFNKDAGSAYFVPKPKDDQAHTETQGGTLKAIDMLELSVTKELNLIMFETVGDVKGLPSPDEELNP